MRSTRRRLDRRASRLLVVASFLVTGGAAASCASSDDAPRSTPPDAAPEAAPEAAASDAGVEAAPPRDSGSWVDVEALPITCTSPPCATSLVTTLGAGSWDLGEGFCALLQDGTVACWGANGAGQLGRGEDAGSIDSPNPTRVVGLSNITSLDHTCAVDKDGAVWCWGTGPFLRDDAGAATTELTPVKLTLPAATSIGIGYSAGCAVTAEGVLCWGNNGDGQLGPDTRDPSDVGGPRPMPVPADSPTRAVTVGRATFALRTDNTLVSWGSNPTIGRVSPIFPDPNPQSVALGGVFMMDLADDNGCATAGGNGYCWGTPVVPPRPGNGSVTERALPEPVVAPEPLVQIATTRTYDLPNEGSQRYRWCATGVSGAVYCAGKNASGQAGDGTKDFAFDAVKVAGLPDRAAQVKTTPDTTCALLTNGKVHCWGSNNNGQLGNGQNRGRSLVPVEVVLP